LSKLIASASYLSVPENAIPSNPSPQQELPVICFDPDAGSQLPKGRVWRPAPAERSMAQWQTISASLLTMATTVPESEKCWPAAIANATRYTTKVKYGMNHDGVQNAGNVTMHRRNENGGSVVHSVNPGAL